MNKKGEKKRFFLLLYSTVLIVLVLIASLTLLSVLEIPNNFRLFVVQSDSMKPAIKQGDLIIVQPKTKYFHGDIITYKTDDRTDIRNPHTTITHRISELKSKKGKILFETKGDANNLPDLNLVKDELVIGKVILHIPWLGYPVGYAKTKEGFIFLIVIPSTLIIYGEIQTLKKEIRKLFNKKNAKKDNL